MQRHIRKVTSVSFYHLRRLRQIRNYVGQTIMAQLVMSLVISRINCNSTSPAFLLVHWRRCNDYKTRLLDWCLILIGGHTSVLHYNSCTGCRWSIVSPSRSQHSCTKFYTNAVHRTLSTYSNLQRNSGTVFLSQLETLTITQHSDKHSSCICSIVLFPRNCLRSLY